MFAGRLASSYGSPATFVELTHDRVQLRSGINRLVALAGTGSYLLDALVQQFSRRRNTARAPDYAGIEREMFLSDAPMMSSGRRVDLLSPMGLAQTLTALGAEFSGLRVVFQRPPAPSPSPKLEVLGSSPDLRVRISGS
ncbi:MAG: hypothetical protein AB7I50_13335 [Vicinamibacterales bacterium]